MATEIRGLDEQANYKVSQSVSKSLTTKAYMQCKKSLFIEKWKESLAIQNISPGNATPLLGYLANLVPVHGHHLQDSKQWFNWQKVDYWSKNIHLNYCIPMRWYLKGGSDQTFLHMMTYESITLISSHWSQRPHNSCKGRGDPRSSESRCLPRPWSRIWWKMAMMTTVMMKVMTILAWNRTDSNNYGT